MSQKRRDGPGIRVSIPRSLYDGILRIQLDEGVDFYAAANKAGSLLEPNGQLFKEAVQKEAQELGQSRFLQQLNKARASIKQNSLMEGAELVRRNEVHFEAPCCICGKPMKFSNGEKNWGSVKAVLNDAFKSWSHVTCKK